ncbi:helix-turn-helix domain-containing protein [Amantichitinum ursilacus]|uniref:DNA-binding transcriptional repressor PuuR n=1 Tax=Amantichitinum ursilacus TaxID=857265 RepID=A0A0N0XGL2_9NEIS|nr:helix-turn-helix transcriptional regulator [Amantichitinum ursilacus]KPC50170.1 DNA-binding transcriptional repressor PuuR [Amantichitinum ursilacus]
MKSAKKTPEQLRELRVNLIEKLTQERPAVGVAARMIRESIGLNQQQFAKLVGLSKVQIARLERGEANPTLETLQAVGKPYGLQIGFYHSQEAGPPSTMTAPPKRPIPLLDFGTKSTDER